MLFGIFSIHIVSLDQCHSYIQLLEIQVDLYSFYGQTFLNGLERFLANTEPNLNGSSICYNSTFISTSWYALMQIFSFYLFYVLYIRIAWISISQNKIELISRYYWFLEVRFFHVILLGLPLPLVILPLTIHICRWVY